MIALASNVPASINWQRYKPLAEAAALLGCNVDHLSRQCREKLVKQGLAIHATPPGGGQKRWFVHRSYDLKLLDGALGLAHQFPKLEGFTQRQRQGAMIRAACVDALREARMTWPGKMKDWLPVLIEQLRQRFKLETLSRSRLLEWDRQYQRPADLVKLIDSRGGNRRDKSDLAAWDAFRDLYLHQNQPSIAQCWKEVQSLSRENGWAWVSYESCRAQLDKRIPPEVQLKNRQPERWHQRLSGHVEMPLESFKAGERWIGDHHQLNVWVSFRRAVIRPWLTAWMDWRTRKIVGWVLSDKPNSTTILGALRHGLKDASNMGGPQAVQIDNGKDFDAFMFHGQTKKQRRERIKAIDETEALGIFNMLKIEPHFSMPYNAKGKARLERYFGSLESFYRVFDTYAGNCPGNRPERLAQILATPHRIPAFEEVEKRLADYIAGKNASADHSIEDLSEDGVKLSPDEAFARWCDTRRVMADEQVLDLLLMQWHKPVTAGRNGVSIAIRGRTITYGKHHPAMKHFKAAGKGDRPLLNVAYDPHDLRSIRVWTKKYRHVCTLEMNQQCNAGAISADDVAEMSRQKKLYEKSLQHVNKLQLTHLLTNEERAAEVAEQRRRKPAAEPNALRIIQTPMDGEPKEIERNRLRPAVGDGTASAPRIDLASMREKLQRNQQPRRREADSLALSDVYAKFRERNQ